MTNYDKDWYRRFERPEGKRAAKGAKQRTITFSLEKLANDQGQSLKEWEQDGLLADMNEMLRQVGQYDANQALAQQMIKQYTKVGFPPDSKFKEPKHVSPAYWAVMHIKPKSKPVVAGYIENDIFYIVFLDKEHHFWPSDIQDRGKTKR